MRVFLNSHAKAMNKCVYMLVQSMGQTESLYELDLLDAYSLQVEVSDFQFIIFTAICCSWDFISQSLATEPSPACNGTKRHVPPSLYSYVVILEAKPSAPSNRLGVHAEWSGTGLPRMQFAPHIHRFFCPKWNPFYCGVGLNNRVDHLCWDIETEERYIYLHIYA